MTLSQLLGGVRRRMLPATATAAITALAVARQQLAKARASLDQAKQEREQLVTQVRRLRALTTDMGVHRHRVPSTQVLRSEEHTSELQSQSNLVCRLLLEKKK